MTNYQKIRAAIEAPLLTAFNSQTPSIPVYFDNVTSVPPDPPSEYVRVNVTFGLMQSAALSQNLDSAQGAVIVRCFSEKGGGPARCQELIEIAALVLKAIASSSKEEGSVFVRTGPITGPSFEALNVEQIEPGYASSSPHFMGRISANWKAIVPC
jgi:hypothetical protein